MTFKCRSFVPAKFEADPLSPRVLIVCFQMFPHFGNPSVLLTPISCLLYGKGISLVLVEFGKLV